MPNLILASGSPRRSELLGLLGVRFTVAPADIEFSKGDFRVKGADLKANIFEVAKAAVMVDVRSAMPSPAAEAAVAITLAIGVLKADHMDGVVRDATMLGVARIAPLVTARTETSVAALTRADRRARWQRIAVSSAKRSALFPDVPTTLESGYANSDYNFWIGMSAPAKMPRAILERLNREVRTAVTSPEASKPAGRATDAVCKP